jgi:3-oxoacyl-[acyl-carrier-protein] synthase III
VIATAGNGFRASITGIGAYVPDRILTNQELSTMVDTSDEWIIERTGIRERRIAAPEQALSDLCRPAIEQALAQAGVAASDIDLLVVATVTPDMAFPSTGAILADELGMPDAGAYDLSAGCTGFMYALAQAYGMMAGGLTERALVVGGDVLSKIMDWTDRTTCVLFGDGAGAVVLERVERGGFLGFELGADGSGGPQLFQPAGGSRMPASAETVAERKHFAQMNGREVFKFATRILVSSGEDILAACGRTIDEVDVYIPHQANVRIIDHALRKLGIPEGKVVMNVDRYGNTSSGSIPLALAEADADHRLHEGDLVLMTGMGAGLTWGSALMEWSPK